MVPAGEITDGTLTKLLPLLDAGDTVVDGGNSYYKDTLRRDVADKKINYIDCGTSCGVWGCPKGYSMTIGGEEVAVERLRPIFEVLAPAKVGPRRPGWLRPLRQDGP